MTKFYFYLSVFLLVFAGCKTASKSYNKGDYADAIELGVKKLQKDPYDAETVNLVSSAYKYAVGQHESTIRSLSGSSDDNRFERILREYNRLQDLYRVIHESPVAAKKINPVDYSDYVNTYRSKVADVHITKAEKRMEEGTKRAYQEAYKEFSYALRYRDDSDLRLRKEKAYEAALTKVLVIPIQNHGGYSYHTDYQLRNFQDQVMRQLAFNMNQDFVKFYSEWDLNNRDLNPDQILEMNLGRIRIGQPYDQRSQRTVTEKVVVKETVFKPDSVVKQYANVSATITTTRRNLLSEADFYITLRDTKGRTIWSDRFTGQHNWQTEFSTYTGDERALSASDKNLLNRTQNYNVPREDEIMEELYRQILNDLSSRLRYFYNRL